jgi:hypothetical protein
MGIHLCHPSYVGSLNKKVSIQVSPVITMRPYLKKINKAKRAGSMAQVVEHLPSKWKTLNSIPSTAIK